MSGGKRLLRLKFSCQYVPKEVSQSSTWKAFLEQSVITDLSFLDFIMASIWQEQNRWQQADCASSTQKIYNPEATSWSAEVWIFALTKSCNCYKHVAHTANSVHWGMQKRNEDADSKTPDFQCQKWPLCKNAAELFTELY